MWTKHNIIQISLNVYTFKVEIQVYYIDKQIFVKSFQPLKFLTLYLFDLIDANCYFQTLNNYDNKVYDIKFNSSQSNNQFFDNDVFGTKLFDSQIENAKQVIFV